MRTLATLARRFAVVSALGLWLGGTTLYTGFVIPIGHRHVGAAKFGLVTGDVTRTLNLVGAAALLVLLVNLAADWRASGRPLRWGLAGAWVLLLGALVLLFVLHSMLDRFLASTPRDSDRFDFWHDGYKLVTAIQWGAGLLHLGCALAAWRRADGARP